MTESSPPTNADASDVASTPGVNGSHNGLRFAFVEDSPPSKQDAAIVVPSALKDDPVARESQTARAPGNAAWATGTTAAQGAPTPGSDSQTIRVCDICKRREDIRGEMIDLVFFKRREFAIYQSGGKILVQYADDDALAKEQIAKIAELLPLKDRLQYLVQNMERPERYHWQIAESLRLGLCGQKDPAKNIMQGAIDDINGTRVRKGRVSYLAVTLGFVTVIVLAAFIASIAIHGSWISQIDHHRQDFLRLDLAVASGAIGALFSCVWQLRARTVATDGDMLSNIVDSVTRIVIGMVSAVALLLVIISEFSSQIAPLNHPDLNWKSVLVIGLLAGFVERLVPDLLEKKLAPIANRISA
jgi:hypothetical protein